jgi:hypothetical protein
MFGHWRVDGYARGSKWGAWWHCTCDCGVSRIVLGQNLRNGRSKSCNRSKHLDLVGQRFGRWRVIGRAAPGWWVCICSCGVRRLVRGNNLLRGKTKSCGCFNQERRTTHGMSKSPEYSSWKAMKQRCLNPNAKDFEHYGGRGITCDNYLSFEPWFADIGPRPPGCTQDRNDINGNYEPGNIRWADAKTQRQNQRRSRANVKRRHDGRRRHGT